MTTNNLDTLPSAAPASIPRGRWPTALLLALGLFFLSEQLIWRDVRFLGFLLRYRSPTRVGDPLLPSTSWLFTTPGEPPPIVLLGSSQVREGLDCRAFEARHPGRRCRNMGLSAGTPLDILFADRSLDAAGVGRRTTITGLFPGMFQTEPKKGFIDLETVRCLVSRGTWKHLTSEHWATLTFGLLASQSPTLRHKDAFWDVWRRVGDDLENAWSGRRPPTPDRVLSERTPRPPEYFRERIGRVNPEIVPTRFTPAHEEALDRLIARERARGNEVFIVDFPTRKGYETTITPEAAAHYRGLVARLGGRSDVVFLSARDLPPLEVRDFHDFTHLAESGRQKVSERLAALVAERAARTEAPVQGAPPGR